MNMDALQEFQEIGEKLQNHLVEETGTRQYKLLLPSDLAEEVQRVAKRRGMTMADLIRYFIKLGLTLTAQMEPGAQLIIQQEGKRDRQIIIPL
jgi:hypothetical protein